MKTQEEYKKIAFEQSQELYKILNGVEWDNVEDILKNMKGVLDYYADKYSEFIDLDYKDINIGLFRSDENKIYFPMQNVEVWDEEESKYFPILSFIN